MVIAVFTYKTAWSPYFGQSQFALPIATIVFDKINKTDAFLKLNTVLCHNILLELGGNDMDICTLQ